MLYAWRAANKKKKESQSQLKCIAFMPLQSDSFLVITLHSIFLATAASKSNALTTQVKRDAYVIILPILLQISKAALQRDQ